MSAMRDILSNALRAPIALNRYIAAMAFSAARFITRTGSSRVGSAFWGVGACVAAFGTAIVIASKLRSEEHTSELQSLMRNSYAVFCLKKKKNKAQLETKP